MLMSTTLPHLITAEEFWLSPQNGKHVELVRGEVRISTPVEANHGPPGANHGLVAGNVYFALRTWSAGKGHWVGVESGFRLNPDTVRGPDVALVLAKNIPTTGVPQEFWEIAPDLAVEVVSSHDTAGEVREKVLDYFAAGTQEIWLVYPATREVVIESRDRTSRAVGGDEVVTSLLLPGFTSSLASFFNA